MQHSSILNPPQRVLMGPGPSDVSARILQTMSAPTLGHLDPEYLRIMDETGRVRDVFQTRNEMTLAISGTGSTLEWRLAFAILSSQATKPLYASMVFSAGIMQDMGRAISREGACGRSGVGTRH